MSLKGKVAIVTGGGTGIGRGISQRFAAEGATVVVAQRRIHKAEEVVELLRKQGAEAVAISVDISKREQVNELMQQTLSRFDRLDILVNNASITDLAASATFLEGTDEFLDDIVDVNLKGTMICSQEAARQMLKREGGAIIHLSSVGAFAAQEAGAVYCATKAAVVALTKAMALELAPLGIRVNCIAPGDIVTENNEFIVEEMKSQGYSGKFFRRIPLGRRGTTDEIAGVVAFLASDDATYIHGATIIVDGGFLTY